MLRFIFINLIIGVFIFSNVHAEGNGGFAGSFLRIGLGARALGMGNAQVASADNGYGLFYNPSALSGLKKISLALSYSSMALDRQFNFIGISLPLKPFAGASVGWVNSGVGNLRAYNSIGEDVGEIDHGLNAFYGAFAIKIISLAQADGNLKNLPSDLINIGIAVKWTLEDIDDNQDFSYSSSGFGFDFGVLIKPHKNFAIGYQIKDINASLSSNTNDIFERGADLDGNFPISNRVGAFFRTPLKSVALAYDFEWSNKGEEKHHTGIEFSSDLATGRLGYDNDHITIGGGLVLNAYKKIKMKLDYAFLNDVEDEGVSHVFSWQFLF